MKRTGFFPRRNLHPAASIEVLAFGEAGEGYKYVAYTHEFKALGCDHNRLGTIAIDLFDTTGNVVDGMTCCSKCLPSGIAVWDSFNK